MEPSFWSWEKRPIPQPPIRVREVAMEPSFWSWEKKEQMNGHSVASTDCRNGAQLLELGKEARLVTWLYSLITVAMEPSFWSWEKPAPDDTPLAPVVSQWSPAFGAGKRTLICRGLLILRLSQWSPAFGAGKSRPGWVQRARVSWPVAMEPSFWSWEKPRATP